jgi:hypothetical protein
VCRVIRIAIPNHFQFYHQKNVEDKLCTHTLWQKKNKSSAGSVLPDFKLTLVYIFFFLKFLKSKFDSNIILAKGDLEIK